MFTELTDVAEVPAAWAETLQEYGITTVGDLTGYCELDGGRGRLAALLGATEPEVRAVERALITRFGARPVAAPVEGEGMGLLLDGEARDESGPRIVIVRGGDG